MNQATYEVKADQYDNDKDVILFLAAVQAIPDHKSAKARKLAAWAIEQMKES